MKNKYLIYALQDPITFEIRYIGKSMSGLDRPKSHNNLNQLQAKSYKNNWVKSLISNGYKPIIKIIQYIINPIELDEAEIYWISYFKNLGCPLTNSTLGGKGRFGFKLSKESKQKIRESNIKYIMAHKKEYTDDEKISISKKIKLAMTDPEVKQKLRKKGTKIIDNNGTYYESIQDAQNKTGLSRDSIRDLLEGRKETVKGYSFTYIKKSKCKFIYPNYNKDKPSKTRKKIQDETGRIFDSMSECAKFHKMCLATVSWQTKRNVRFKLVN